MTYFDYLNFFHQWGKSNYLPGTSKLLYYSLLSVFNEAGWPKSIQVDNYRLMSMVDTRTERMAISARDKLVDAGFVKYTKGKKKSPNRYYLEDCTHPKASESGSESDSDSVSISVSESDSDSVSKTVSHIKTKTKTKTKTEDITPLPPLDETERFNGELKTAVDDWIRYKQERREQYKPTGLKALLTQIENTAKRCGDTAVIETIRASMAANYQGIVFDKLRGGGNDRQRDFGAMPEEKRRTPTMAEWKGAFALADGDSEDGK